MLRDVFDGMTGIEEFRPKNEMLWPNYEDVLDLATLIAEATPEEDLQRCLTNRPSLLLGATGDGDDSELAFLPKPRIGNSFVADYALFKFSQGGCTLRLVEIEPADAPLFTRAGTPARRLQSAIGQVEDWGQWASRNTPTLVRDLIDQARLVPEHPARSAGGAFRLLGADALEQAWKAYGGFDHPRLRYSIVIGRWGRLKRKDRERLIYWNQQHAGAYEIRTYDQLIRRGLSRPFVRNY